jgi:hypothetical protein
MTVVMGTDPSQPDTHLYNSFTVGKLAPASTQFEVGTGRLLTAQTVKGDQYKVEYPTAADGNQSAVLHTPWGVLTMEKDACTLQQFQDLSGVTGFAWEPVHHQLIQVSNLTTGDYYYQVGAPTATSDSTTQPQWFSAYGQPIIEYFPNNDSSQEAVVSNQTTDTDAAGTGPSEVFETAVTPAQPLASLPFGTPWTNTPTQGFHEVLSYQTQGMNGPSWALGLVASATSTWSIDGQMSNETTSYNYATQMFNGDVNGRLVTVNDTATPSASAQCAWTSDGLQAGCTDPDGNPSTDIVANDATSEQTTGSDGVTEMVAFNQNGFPVMNADPLASDPADPDDETDQVDSNGGVSKVADSTTNTSEQMNTINGLPANQNFVRSDGSTWMVSNPYDPNLAVPTSLGVGSNMGSLVMLYPSMQWPARTYE